MDHVGKMREVLCRESITLEKRRAAFINPDTFVTQTQGNTIVQYVTLCPYNDDPGNYEIWDKICRGVGNLEGIKALRIRLYRFAKCDPDWEIVARILGHVRNNIELVIRGNNTSTVDRWGTEDVRGLSRAIYGNPMIQKFEPGIAFPFESSGVLCSALATLPALDYVCLSHQEEFTELVLVNPEPLTELLRSPSLRFVVFRRFCFTRALSRAVADALREGSAITTLNILLCSFSEGESAAMIAIALKRNETLKHFWFRNTTFDEAFCDAMAVSLLTNSTLQDMTLVLPDDGNSSAWLPSVFLALGMNSGLKNLCINGHESNGPDLADEQLCAAMVTGLGKNSMLESLHLNNSVLSDADAASGRNALAFLRTNNSLKFLVVEFGRHAIKSRVFVFRKQAASMLEQNTSLESLTMQGTNTKIEDYRSVLSALQSNTTLTCISLQFGSMEMTNYEANELTSVVKRNYGLQHIRAIPNQWLELHAILRLNGAGRRYLVKDGSSISKGVDVLSAVSDDINCLFLHLLENPRLCDRRAVEMMSKISDSDRLPNTAGWSGKREQARPDKGQESRIRLH
jgi:hypothetical protein